MTFKEGKEFLKARPELSKKVWVVKAGFDNKISVLKVGEKRYPLNSIAIIDGNLVYNGNIIIV